MYERLFLSAILPRRSPSSCDTISPTYSMIKSPREVGGRLLEGQMVYYIRGVEGGGRGWVIAGVERGSAIEIVLI